MNNWFVFPKVYKVSFCEDGDFGSVIFHDRKGNKMEFQYYGEKDKEELMARFYEALNRMKGV